MFVASVRGSGTFLLLGEEIVGDGEGCHMLCDDGHQEFVKAGHEGNGTEVTCIGGGVLLVYEDGGSCLPGSRDIFCKKTMAKHLSKDLTVWIKDAKVTVLQAVFARSRVCHRAKFGGEFVWRWGGEQVVVGSSGRDKGSQFFQ